MAEIVAAKEDGDTQSATKKQRLEDTAANNKDYAADTPEAHRPTLLPFTVEGNMPQKRFYRSRAHCNPLSHNDIFQYPTRPDLMNWSDHFPNVENGPRGPDVLDIGCGFGGLTVALSTLLPNKLVLGIEIRPKVAEFVRLRIVASRKENPGSYENCSVLRNNTMKYMPNFFEKATLDKIFICFPDPHFKRKNHPRRIVSDRLLTEYAYFLKPGALLYLITDVKDLHQWHVDKCRSHPLFRELSQEEMDIDPCVKVMYSETEEGKKVERSQGSKFYAVYQRIVQEDARRKDASIQLDTFWQMGEFGVSTNIEQGKEE